MALLGRETAAVATCIVLAVLMTAVVGARLWTRRVLQKSFALEDWLVSVALILSLGLFGGIMIGICVFGYDSRTSELSYTQRVNASWWLFLAEFGYIVDTGIIKVGILLFYRRMSDCRVSQLFIYTLYAMMAEVIIYKSTYILIILLSCRPLQARWEQNNPLWASQHSYTCLSERLNILIGSTINATEDLVIGLLPIMILWHLRIPRAQKLAIWCIFALSIFTSLMSYLRTVVIYQAYWLTDDYIHKDYWLFLLSGVEVAFASICASAPALKPFLAHFGFIKRSQPTETGSSMISHIGGSTLTKSTRNPQSVLEVNAWNDLDLMDVVDHGTPPGINNKPASSVSRPRMSFDLPANVHILQSYGFGNLEKPNNRERHAIDLDDVGIAPCLSKGGIRHSVNSSVSTDESDKAQDEKSDHSKKHS